MSSTSFPVDVALRIGAIADRPEDDDAERLKHRFLIFMGLAMSVGGLTWGGIASYFSLWMPAMIPFGYVVVTALNLFLLNRTKNFEIGRNVQVLVSLLLPFFFQWALGGFVSSGGMMLWAMLALCGSLTFSETRQSVLWLAIYVVLTLISGAIDSDVRPRYALDLPPDVIVAFFVVNLTMITTSVFGLMIYLTSEQKTAASALIHANTLVTELNAQLEHKVADQTAELRARLVERQAILDNLVDGLVAADNTGRLTLMNRALTKQLDLGEDQTPRGDDTSFQALMSILDESGEADKPVTAEIVLPGQRIAAVSAAPILSDEGVDHGVVALVRDVTLEREVDRMKTDFIATVSHEMRTPLTSVMGFAKVTAGRLEDKIFPHVPDDDKKAARAVSQVRRNMEIIVSEGERLTALINDVLDISKMEAGRMEWHRVPLDASTLVRRACDATAALFPEDGPVALEIEIGDDLPTLVGDADRLLQVVLNLLSNAAKFTDRGTVTVGAHTSGDGVEIFVRDTGDGIPPHLHDAVFEKFRQVGDTLTEKPRGTGLGLPICKQIVDAHHGRMSVQSTLGAGSTFTVWLPAADAAEIAQQADALLSMRSPRVPTPLPASRVAAAPHRTDGRPRVLVVDDDPSLRELLEIQLSERGYDVDLASGGNDAISKIRTEPPDVVVLDVKMPDLSGYDVAAMLRNDPATESIPIMMLSILEDRERGARVGVDHHMVKPADPDELAAVLGRIALERAHHRSVLVIDAQTGAAADFAGMLHIRGFHVHGCDGPGCIERAHELRPDLIVIDDAVDDHQAIVQAIRSNPELEHVIVVQLTEGGRIGSE